MECKFEVGQKVVCIAEKPWNNGFVIVPGPTKGDIVTITYVGTNPKYSWIGIGLKEFPIADQPGDAFGERRIFNAGCFRPLNERPTETSIEVFQKLLTPNKQLERV